MLHKIANDKVKKMKKIHHIDTNKAFKVMQCTDMLQLQCTLIINIVVI